MTKRDDLYAEARSLYVIHGMTLKAIAERLAVSVRTLQNWSKGEQDDRGSWDEQRAKLVDGDAALYSELFSLTTVVARKIKDDLLSDRPLDPKQVANLERMLNSVMKAWKQEQRDPKVRAGGPKTKEEAMKEIEGKIRDRLGLR